jgi:uncharacterized protein HemY
VEKAPSNASYHYHLGLAFLKTGEIANGQASLRRALDSSPSQATAAEIQRALDAL